MACDHRTARRLAPASIVLCGLTLGLPAAAQEGPDTPAKRPTVTRKAPPSPNATINLINLLVQQNVITEEQAKALIKQAEDEAYVARQAVSDAAKRAEGAEKTAATAADAVSPPGTKRVTYVPEIVKKQLREEIKQEVMAKAQQEHWAAPGALPEWASRIRVTGDVRVRYEADRFPKGNDPISAVNYNAINAGSPYDVSNANTFPFPTFNVDQDRNRARLRARLGVEADLFEGFTAGVRIATGDTNSPVSFNQSLGGSGGNFSKYAIWLDRAYINYSPWDDLTVSAGRFSNPFFSPTDLVYHSDLGWDGVAAKVKHEIMSGVTPFAVAGAFPIFNTDFNFGSQRNFVPDGTTPVFGKLPSHDKYMFGGQVGTNVRPAQEIDFTLAAAYYDFVNVRGKLSDPCFTLSAQDVCDTDLTRPSFAQRGNTYMMLRNLALTDANGTALPQFQFFGLASAFQDAVLSSRLDLGYFDPWHVILDGEYVRNVAWKRDEIAAAAAANLLPASGAIAPNAAPNTYIGGPQGWLGRLTVGNRELKQLWDWNVHAGYKWLESDAVIDAFTDSDFGLGGTNLKGYFVGASLGLGPNVWASARWMSANQVAGAPFAVDIFLVDLNGKF